jgi:cyanate permease
VLEYVETPLAVYGACAAYGLAVGNIITLSPMIVQREFTPDRFPAIVALSTAVMQTLYAFGPGLLGVLRDVSGSYGVPLAVCMGLNLTASALILMRSRRPA